MVSFLFCIHHLLHFFGWLLIGRTSRLMHQSLADVILIVHACFIAFVVGGLVLVSTGWIFRWSWIRNFWFRFAHLLAIGIVVAEAWFGMICPLTDWESFLREQGGHSGYSGNFIQYWLQKFIFYDFPPWVFTAAYTIFGALVLLTWLLAPPRLPGSKDKTEENRRQSEA